MKGNEKMIKEHILPLGTIVKLERGDKGLMIVGRAQLYNNEGTIGYFDYSAVLYPEGIRGNDGFIFFNDEDVQEVVFEGYRDEQEKIFAQSYEENIANTSYPRLHIQ